jgi:hypothetical protein
MDRKLIGILSNSLNPKFAGQRIYILNDNSFQLEDGETISREILMSLQAEHLIQSVTPDSLRMDSILPEHVDPRAENNPIYPVGELLCRISPSIDLPYAGDLVYRSNVDGHYISENGYVIKLEDMQALSVRGALVKTDLLYTSYDPYASIGAGAAQKKEPSPIGTWVMHNVLPLLIGIVLIVVMVVFGVPIVRSALSNTGASAPSSSTGNAAVK